MERLEKASSHLQERERQKKSDKEKEAETLQDDEQQQAQIQEQGPVEDVIEEKNTQISPQAHQEILEKQQEETTPEETATKEKEVESLQPKKYLPLS
jgi:hypothetical protein